MRDDARASDELPEDRERMPVVVRDETTRLPLRTIAAFAAVPSRRLPLSEILEAALDALHEALAVRRSSVMLRDAGGIMRVRASRGVSPQLREAVEAFTPWTGQATGARLVAGDVHVDPELAALSAAGGAENVRSVLFLPLFIDGRLVGRLDAYLDHQRIFSADERAAAEAIAHVLALAVAGNREHRGRPDRTSEELGASLDVEATPDAVARFAIEDVADANQSKANFLAVMSHELRTPLTAILGYAELLADEIMGPLSEPQRDQLLRIHASGLHLLSLIEEILSYSRIEAGQESVTLEPIELSMLADATRSIIGPLAARKKLRYQVQVPDAPAVIVTDAAKVRQILINVLANAVKFTDSGTISLSASLEGDDTVFRVRDTGVGIPPEHFEHIFEPFWQVEQTMTRRVGGTGLGLSIARQLAGMLGGEVCVTSDIGEGSTFTLRIPAGRSDAGGRT